MNSLLSVENAVQGLGAHTSLAQPQLGVAPQMAGKSAQWGATPSQGGRMQPGDMLSPQVVRVLPGGHGLSPGIGRQICV